MATEVWPPVLPCPQIEGYTEQQEPTIIRTQMDTGPAKVRRRYTMPVTKVNIKVCLDRGQMEELWDFYTIRLQGGVQRFNMNNPWENVTREYRFINPPAISGLTQNFWEASLELERFM